MMSSLLQYGFWRLYVDQMIYYYLDCGYLINGLTG